MASQSATEDVQQIPRATHTGDLVIGDLVIPCAVLEPQGRQFPLRVLSERGVARVFGKTGRGSPSWYRLRQGATGPTLPLFLSAKNLIPFIPSTLLVQLSDPIVYRGLRGARSYGIRAELLGEICKVWIDAGHAGILGTQQERMAFQAEVLRDALVGVALSALVDDATGYVRDRDRDELHRILEAYIAPALMPWTKRFPDEFYEELFRLRGWTYNPPSVKRPKIVGKITNQLVYEPLAPSVLDELKRLEPLTETGHRKHTLHQHLTDIGNEHLGRQLASVMTLMRVSNSWTTFDRLFKRAFGPRDPQGRLDLGFEDDEEEDA